VKPWEWRQGARRDSAESEAYDACTLRHKRLLKRLLEKDTATPGQCRIKGNIDAKGERIYHMPGGQWYDRTKIDRPRPSDGSVLRLRQGRRAEAAHK
jgi:hypothetical protein